MEFPHAWSKEFAYEQSIPLTDILNASYSQGIVPSQWKKAVDIPIPQTSPPNVEKLRPISLTDCFAKIAEGFVAKWINQDIGDVIDPQQFGNVSGVSTSHYLVSLLHYLHQGADKTNNVGTMILTDFSKAFDLVDHTVMINKFISLGVRGAIVPWLCSFVSGRKQCVRYNQALSDYKLVKAGLPQGTKIGPIGFQAVINDAAQDKQSNTRCWKYVDDLTLAENRVHPNPTSLQFDLDNFIEWSKENKLTLNPSKCQALQICFKKKAPPHPDFHIEDVPLQFVTQAKILGVWLQDDLKWDKNVNEISIKSNRRLYMLRTL